MAEKNRVMLIGRVAGIISDTGLRQGDRLFEARLAAQLDVSRAPVRVALDELCRLGVVGRELNKGYILQRELTGEEIRNLQSAGADQEDLYMAIANDRLDGALPSVMREQELVRRYDLTLAEVRRVMARILAEGWAERLPGYGWRFSDMLDIAEANIQMMNFRRMFEPKGLLEPKFRLEKSAAERIRKSQRHVLDRGPMTFSASELFHFGCDFHETLAEASGNVFLLDALRRANTMRRLYCYRLHVDAEDRIIQDINEHFHILDLIAARDMQAASDSMAAHLRP
jgi:DNA-binding GntR family transcriptional regulator